jgi:uncharacterized protein YegL
VDIEQTPFVVAEFADNPEPRCPCVLLLDTSGSMQGSPIAALNAGLQIFKDELAADSMAAKRVEISVISFGPVRQITDFQTADEFDPPTLTASGDTPMGSAIELAIECIRLRKEVYRTNGITYYRPWIFLLTDGGPTDGWKRAASKVREGEAIRSFQFFAVGVQGANFDTLKQISVREPLRLDGLRFRDMFSWLSNSLGGVSKSQPGEQILLAPPTGPSGWASVG